MIESLPFMQKTLSRVLIFFVVVAGFLFVAKGRASAQQPACFQSCQAQFFSDNDLSNKINAFAPTGPGTYDPGDMWIAYPVNPSSCTDIYQLKICPDVNLPPTLITSGQNLTALSCPNGVLLDERGNHFSTIDAPGIIQHTKTGDYLVFHYSTSWQPLQAFNGLTQYISDLRTNIVLQGQNKLLCSDSTIASKVGTGTCQLSPPTVTQQTPGHYTISYNQPTDGLTPGNNYTAVLIPGGASISTQPLYTNVSYKVGDSLQFGFSDVQQDAGTDTLCIKQSNLINLRSRDCDGAACSIDFPVNAQVAPITNDQTKELPPTMNAPATGPAGNSGSVNTTITPFDICAQIPHDAGASTANEYNQCEACAKQSFGTYGKVGGVWTAVGCIPISSTQLITSVIKLGLGIAGGVALIMILAAGLMFSTSQGEPKKAGEARDLMTSAVVGLVFIIFSVAILQFIGVNLLQIPGFGTK